ncbi:patatin family protein [Moritella sp. 28]|nr:patatin family protein [Moritella sp. 28]
MSGNHHYYSAHRSQENRDYSVNKANPIALVVEGGGQKGIFTAGVLDAFLKEKFNPFSLLIGTSAGALNLASYICGQYRHAYRVITEATMHKSFFNMRSFLFESKGMDLDWLIEQTKTKIPLDWNRGYENMTNRVVLVTATQADNNQVDYFDLFGAGWELALKASCSIPGIYNTPATLDKYHWLDGGVQAPIPLEEVYRQGYKHIVVIRTAPPEVKYEHKLLAKLTPYIKNLKAKEIMNNLIDHEESYLKAQMFLESPPEDVSIYELHPTRLLKSKLIGSKKTSLDYDYQQGFDCGRQFLESYQGIDMYR